MDLKSGEVVVTALTAFRGQAWEGRGGEVMPGDTFNTPRLRAVELKANGLVRDADPVSPARPAKVVANKGKAP